MYLSADLNESRKYYSKYLECYASEKLCQQKNSNNTQDYLTKYTQCFEEWNTCKAEKQATFTATQQAQSQLSTCQTEKKSAEDGKMVFGIGGLIIGALGYYFIFVRPKEKPAVSSAESQLPRNR